MILILCLILLALGLKVTNLKKESMTEGIMSLVPTDTCILDHWLRVQPPPGCVIINSRNRGPKFKAPNKSLIWTNVRVGWVGGRVETPIVNPAVAFIFIFIFLSRSLF